MPRTFSVGYFAYAQYDVKTQVKYFAHAQYDEICFTVFASRRRGNLPGGWQKKYVILNAVKNPTEELMDIYFSLWSWDISLTLNME